MGKAIDDAIDRILVTVAETVVSSAGEQRNCLTAEIEARIAVLEERAATAKRQYNATAQWQMISGLKQALAIVRGEDPDGVE